jgi:hypothetical protein
MLDFISLGSLCIKVTGLGAVVAFTAPRRPDYSGGIDVGETQSSSIPQNMPLSVSLPAARWNLVLMLLDTSVRSLITDIQDQCMQQSAMRERFTPRGNGAAPDRPEARE